jgi:hypothetical protein
LFDFATSWFDFDIVGFTAMEVRRIHTQLDRIKQGVAKILGTLEGEKNSITFSTLRDRLL